MPGVLIFSGKLYGFFKDKICCNNYQQPHSRGLISVTAWQYVNSAQKTEKTEQKAPERKVLFWYDPMKPDTKFDKPGKSPFMDMDWCQNMLMTVAIKAVAGSVSTQPSSESGIKNAKSHARNAELFSDNPG